MTIKRAAWNTGKTVATHAGRYAYRKAKESTALKVAGFAAGITAGLAAATVAWIHTSRRHSMRGKIVVITGGSRGLGLEIARQFGLAGAHLVLAARDEEELQRARIFLAHEKAVHNAESLATVTADVSTREGAQHIVNAARDRYGRTDVLINNAGIIHVAPFVDQPAEVFEESMRINFFGVLYMTQAVVEEMRTRGEGHIINIASLGGKIAVPHMLPYVASKFALVGFSEGLHAELKQDGVHVLTVCPGLMRTGAHVQAHFGGRRQEEYRWFSLGATLPGLSIAARAAARKIFRAAIYNCAEITITPQAWLAARLVGIAPGISACLAGSATQLLLPKPGATGDIQQGKDLRQPKNAAANAWSIHLQTQHNQSSE